MSKESNSGLISHSPEVLIRKVEGIIELRTKKDNSKSLNHSPSPNNALCLEPTLTIGLAFSAIFTRSALVASKEVFAADDVEAGEKAAAAEMMDNKMAAFMVGKSNQGL